MPRLILIAGPNGSGKTTLVRSGILADLFDIPTISINSDDVARDYAGGGAPSPEQSLRAAQYCDNLLDQHIAAGRSVAIETVLSSDKFQSRVVAARAAGFMIVLVYVTLALPGLNAARVAQRHATGGHDVPADRIAARRVRSHGLFEWFARAADIVRVFENTEELPRLAARKHAGAWTLFALNILPTELAATIRQLAAEIEGD